MNVGKYYVAGIPFDSENSLKHYGVKGMEWNKHKFGIDADDRYIKWLKNAGQNIGRFGANVAQNVAKGVTNAARTAGTAVNKGANFVTGNQARQNMRQANAAFQQKKQEASKYSSQAQNPVRAMGYAGDTKYARPSEWFDKDAGLTGRDYSQQIADQHRVYAGKAANAQKQANELEKKYDDARNEYRRTMPYAIENSGKALQNVADTAGKAVNGAVDNAIRDGGATAQNFGRTVSNAAQNVGNTVGQAAQNVGNAVGNFFSNRDEYQRLDDLSKHYDPNTGKWDSEENRKAFYDAQDAYNRHPATAIPDMARQIGSDISNGPIGDFARGVGGMANEIGNNVKNFVDYNITGEGQRRMADMLMQNPDQVNKIYENDGSGWKQVSQHTNAEAAERELSDAKNNTLFGRVGNAANAVGQAAQNVGNTVGQAANNVGNTVGQAAQNVGNAVSGAANKATEGAKGFLNSAGKWVSDTANNVKNTASKAASDTTKGAKGFLNSAGQWVSNAAGNVKNAAQNVGNTVGQAAQNVENTLGQAAQDVGNTVGQAAEQARGGIGGFFDRVGNAVGGAAQNVGNWAGNAAKDVGNAVGGAANAVGDWAGNAAKDVGGAVQNAGNWIGDRAQDVSDWYTGGNKGEQAAQLRDQAARTKAYGDRLVDEGTRGIGDAFERETPGMMFRNEDRGNPDSSAYASKTRDDVRTALDNARDIRDRGYDVWNEAGDLRAQAGELQRAYDAAPRQRLSAGANAVGGAVSGAAQNIANAVTGVPGAVSDWVGDRVADARDAITAPARQNEWDQLTARNQAIRDENERKFNELGGWGGSGIHAYNPNSGYMLENDLEKSWDQYHNNVRDINQHPVSSAVNYAAGNVADWARNVAGNVGNWAGQAAQNVGNFVSEMANPHYQLNAQQLTDNYRQYLNEHPENPQSPQHADWLRDQVKNDPQLRAYYEQYMKHSALSDKPDGVSDAFWEKFTADGGTREDYERDWR